MVKSTVLYDRLGVPSSATSEEIKSGYRKAVMQCHPDRFPDDAAKAQQFQEVQSAYDLLMDPEKRKLYDETGIMEEGDQTAKLTAEAMDNLTMLFGQVAEQLDDPDNQNPLEAVRTQILHKAHLYQQQSVGLKERQRKLGIVLKRLTRKDGQTNVFALSIQDKIDQATRDLRANEQTQQILGIMHNLLANYGYNLAPRDPTRGSFGAGFGTTSTSSSTNPFASGNATLR